MEEYVEGKVQTFNLKEGMNDFTDLGSKFVYDSVSDLVEIGRQNRQNLKVQFLIFFLCQCVDMYIGNTILEQLYKYHPINMLKLRLGPDGCFDRNLTVKSLHRVLTAKFSIFKQLLY